MEALELKKFFFQLDSFIDKTTSNFYPFNKFNDFVNTQYATTIFYPLSKPLGK